MMEEKEVYQNAVMEILEFTVDNRIYTGLIGGNESGDVGELTSDSEKLGAW